MRLAFCAMLLSAAAAAQQYVISTYAGAVTPPAATPAVGRNVPIGTPYAVAADAAGNIFFASFSLNSVFKLDPTGVLTRVAGYPMRGYSGDGGPATSARLQLGEWPSGSALAVDSAGNLFIADTGNHSIRRVTPDGIITTVAGNGGSGFSGDGGPATSAQLNRPAGVAVDRAGNLFIADALNDRVRQVSPSGIITTVAELARPTGVAVDDASNLFIAHSGAIGKLSRDGITRVAGNGVGCSGPDDCLLGDGGPATSAALCSIPGMAVDGEGNLFIADICHQRIRKVSASGTIATVAGSGDAGYSGDGGPAPSAQLNRAVGVAVDSQGNLFIADYFNQRVRKVAPSGLITTVAGNGTSPSSFSGDGGPAIGAQLNLPMGQYPYSAGVAVDRAGNLFIADAGNHRIRKVSAAGIITTVAGSGSYGFSGDGGPATSASLGSPSGVAVDPEGNLFIADTGRIRKVSPRGIITTVAAVASSGVAVDAAGNLFIVDSGRIRKVSPDGIITTVAGGSFCDDEGNCPPLGDGGPATSARLFATAVAVDAGGNLFVADNQQIYEGTSEHRIRKVSTSGIITTVAGGASNGFSGDGGPATRAKLSFIAGIALDRAGNLFIADITANRIRKIDTGGIITTVAGNGFYGFSGDGGPAITAQLGAPAGVTVDSAGNLYVAEVANGAIRILRPADRPVLIGAVADAASQRADPVSPGKIVVVSGAGLGPSELVQNQPKNGLFSTELGGTAVSFDGIAAPILYASATQVAAIVPYAVTGATAQVTVANQRELSAAFTVPVAASAPSLFTLNQTGAGQAAAINAVDGTANTAANPVKIGGYISLYATGEGQTAPAGVDGRIGSSTRPVLSVRATVGGIPATVQYAGGAPGQVAGLMQVNVQIPSGVQPGGYVPVLLQVGDRSSSPAVWIAVSGN